MRLSLSWDSCRNSWLSPLDNMRSVQVCLLPAQVPHHCLYPIVKQNKSWYGKITYYAISVSTKMSFSLYLTIGKGENCTLPNPHLQDNFYTGCKKWSRWEPVTQSEEWGQSLVEHPRVLSGRTSDVCIKGVQCPFQLLQDGSSSILKPCWNARCIPEWLTKHWLISLLAEI